MFLYITISKLISRCEGEKSDIAGDKHDFQNSFTHHKETSKTSQSYLQDTFDASAVKLKKTSYILVISVGIGLLHRSYVEEWCHGKDTASMCLGEKSDMEEGVSCLQTRVIGSSGQISVEIWSRRC